MQKKIIKELKIKLSTQRAELEKELKSFAVKDKNIKDNWEVKRLPAQDAGIEEKADEAEEYDNLVSLEHNLELKLRDINTALEKIKRGGYGICEKCGKEIEEERLIAIPEARLCIECNKQFKNN